MFNFIPAKILSYDADQRTAQVHIVGLTDGAESFMTQLLQILPNAPTVDFEQLKQLWIEQSTHHIAI